MKPTTIRDVARLSGVSVTTVSRVLNGRPDVNAETRTRVMQVIDDCNFVRNANAINLKQADGEFAAVIVRGYNNPFLANVAEKILSLSTQSDVSFLMEFIDERGNEFTTALRMFNEKRATGFILLGSRVDDRASAIASLDVPFVFSTVNAMSLPLRRVASVCIDDRAAAKHATEKLLALGHRRIAIFGGRADRGDSLAIRYVGARDAYESRGLPFDEGYCVETRFSLRGAYDSAKAFFLAHPDTTAVFAMSDMVAIGVMRALRDLGLRVPEDVSVMGFDGVEIGRFTMPTLATLRQPVDRIAQESVNALLGMMHDGASGGDCLLDAELLDGESIAPPHQ